MIPEVNSSAATDEDGSYRVAGMPGPGADRRAITWPVT